MTSLTIDFETRSECSLEESGAWVYSEHPSTEVFCMAYKIDDQPARIWINTNFPYIDSKLNPYLLAIKAGLPLMGNILPINLIDSLDVIEAHNVFFERSIWENIMIFGHGFPFIPDRKWRCSAAKAATFALPRSLDDAGSALNLPTTKDKQGYFIMKKLSKPRKPTKKNPDKWNEDPEDLIKLFKYCLQDVESEYALSEALEDLSERETKIWAVDQEINKRGLYIDIAAAKAAIELLLEYKEKLLIEFNQITGLDSPNQVAETLKWLLEASKIKHSWLLDLTKTTVSKILDNPDVFSLNEKERRVLEIRQSVAKSSTAKFKRMVSGVSEDHRARDLFMYYGASTGRWAGKRIQPHNMPRKIPDNFETILDNLPNMDLDTFELIYGDPLKILSSCIRGFISAAPGKDLLCADYTSIEGVFLAWLAEEEYIVQNYRDGKDPYAVFASQLFNVPYNEIDQGNKKGISKYEEMRFQGKTGELACGYQGGEKAVSKFSPETPIEKRKAIVEAWRINRPKTVGFWKRMERFALSAVKDRKTYTWNNIKWGVSRKFLHCQLPSGRVLSYYDPQLRTTETPWGETKLAISFMGVDTETKQWKRQFTYGGKLVENIVQATARDILAEALVRLEASKKYPVVLHVHDEAVAEIPEGSGDVQEFCDIMAEVPAWATGCPITVKGFRTKRYNKKG